MKDSDMITVCDACNRACCWHGAFMCDDAYTAGTDEVSVAELRKLDLENEEYWEDQIAEK